MGKRKKTYLLSETNIYAFVHKKLLENYPNMSKTNIYAFIHRKLKNYPNMSK